jgi:hypothetical protein
MAPVLFIEHLQVMAETLEDKWEAADITLSLHRHPQGCMPRLVWDTKGKTFKINHILYNDGKFVFDTKSDMIKGAEILRKHMTHFGLIMHIGRDEKKSKTEAVYFPPPGVKATPEDVAQLGVNNDQGYITFTEYLPSLFNTDLRDDQEIAARFNKVNQ